jgi:hypothetical protein
MLTYYRLGVTAAITLLIGLAFLGLGGTNASAAVFCSNSASPCPEEDTYPIGTELHAALSKGSASFVGEKSTLNCGVSTITGKSTASGTPIAGQISALTFSSCELGCTTEALHLPYKAEVETTGGDDGVVTLSNGGSGVPQVRDICLGKSCTFGAAKVSLDLEGGAPASIKAVNEPLTREGGEKAICGETAKFSAVYGVSEPMALFVASRSAPKVSLCSSSTSPCAEGDAYPLGTELHAALSAGSVGFVGEKSTLHCSSSSMTGKTTGLGAPMVGQVSALTLSGCEFGCTAEALHLPYKAEVEASGAGKGVLTLSNGGSGVPQIRNFCLGKSCTFGAAKVSLDLEGGAPASIKAVNEPLTREGGEKAICGETAKFSAVYGVSEPMALFVEAAGIHSLYFGLSANTRSFKNPGDEQDLVLETGADRIREDLEWEEVEPSNESWEWSGTDELYEAAAERGISILPVLNSPPCWAVPKETKKEDCWRTYPVSDAEFGEFTAHAVARYGPGGDFWDEHPELDGGLAPRYFEIWNEPYYPQFTNDDVDPARYTDLYKAAVVAGREVNASARYLVESTVDVENPAGPGWVNWAKGMVEEEPKIGEYIDGIAIHPYPQSHDPYYAPQSGTDASFKNTDRIYSDWASQGIRRPIWITEVGYSSCGENPEYCVFGETQAAREQLKAVWLSDLFAELASEEYPYVHAVYLYNLRGSEEVRSDSGEWFGILNSTAEELPARASFVDAVEKFAGVPLAYAIIAGHTIGGGNASFTFTAGDPTASFSCQLDSGSWTGCTSPKSYTGVGAGSHTFRVKATNAEGTEPTPATYSW